MNSVLVEVSSRTIIQFLEMFMDLGSQRETDLKYICGIVRKGPIDRDDVYFCVLGMGLKRVTVSCRECGAGNWGGWHAAVQVRMQVLIHLGSGFLRMYSPYLLAGTRLDAWS